MNRTDKELIIEELKGELLLDGGSVVLAEFKGLTVENANAVRAEFREAECDYRVIKNTLAKRSFEELGIDGMDVLLEGPTAFAISKEDEVAPAQLLKKFASEYEFPRFKGGYVAGRLLDEKETVRLASLPAREVLQAQVVGTFQAPLRGLVGVLNASLRDLVGVLDAIREKQGAA